MEFAIAFLFAAYFACWYLMVRTSNESTKENERPGKALRGWLERAR